MPNPIFVLAQLNKIQVSIWSTQARIDLAREQMSHDQVFQLWMDREQAELDVRQAKLDLIMLSISSMN